jgi:hypothetical protein
MPIGDAFGLYVASKTRTAGNVKLRVRHSWPEQNKKGEANA